MKTSVIEVHDMLSVLNVDELEKRIGEVPGVESVTVNYAAQNATVRYDETRLEIGDIKSAVRQRGYESAAPSKEHEGHTATNASPATPTPTAVSKTTQGTPPIIPASTVEPKTVPGKPATAGAASTSTDQQDKKMPDKS